MWLLIPQLKATATLQHSQLIGLRLRLTACRSTPRCTSSKSSLPTCGRATLEEPGPQWRTTRGRATAATAQSYYDYVRPTLLWYLGAVWGFILALPLAPQIVNAAQPYAVYVARTYNQSLAEAEKSSLGIVRAASGYLPSIPVEKVRKVE